MVNKTTKIMKLQLSIHNLFIDLQKVGNCEYAHIEISPDKNYMTFEIYEHSDDNESDALIASIDITNDELEYLLSILKHQKKIWNQMNS